MQALWLNTIGVAGAVFLFGFAVFIHELGHFLVAKWCGVGVSKFAIGFGPKICAFTRGETEYSIRWFPLGGFVALKGMIEGLEEEPPEEAEEEEPEPDGGNAESAGKESSSDEKPEGGEAAEKEDEKSKQSSLTEDLDALKNKPYLVKVAVFIAGVTCNYISAMFLMAVLLAYGSPTVVEHPSNQIVEIPESTRLYELGWRSGDRVVGLQSKSETVDGEAPNEKDFTNWNEVMGAINDALPPIKFRTWEYLKSKFREPAEPPTLQLIVDRNGTRQVLPFPVKLFSDEEESRFFSPANPPYLLGVTANSPADRARLVKDDYTMGEVIRPYPSWDDMKRVPLDQGDKIVAVNQQPVETWLDMTKILHANPGKAITLTVERGPEKKLMLLTTTLERDDQFPERGRLGIMSGFKPTGPRKGMPVGEAILAAPMRTLEFTDRILYFTAQFFATKSSREIKRNVGGPVAIVKMAFKSAQRGLDEYLYLFIYISIVLAIMNLLPIPVLDGGYIVISTVEVIIRRPIPPKILTPILTVFMILFLLLFVFLFYNDFMNQIFKL